MDQPLNFKTARDMFDKVDRFVTNTMARVGIPALRVGMGVVFIWFGALKFFPGLSPAEDLVRNSIVFFDPVWFVPVLALWEVLIGVGFITGKFPRITIALLFAQMGGTLLPLVTLPQAVWVQFPFVLTLEGQYIIKNMVLIAAAMVIGATVRGGRLQSEPTE